MDTFAVLEEKVIFLVEHVKKLQNEKKDLVFQNDSLIKENNEAKVEKAKLVEEIAQLHTKVTVTEHSSTKESEKLEKLNKERELTKIAVDDLIKSIDGIVKSEKQQ